MKPVASLFISILILSWSCSAPQQPPAEGEADDPLNYVNPFIGTGGHGHTYPGASLPFGMVQLSPDNGTEGWDWCSGYNYADSTIAGFSHLHLSGTGVGDLYDILYMPVTGKMDFPEKYTRTSALQYFPDHRPSEPMPYWSSFSHEEEEASPGYYRVLLADYGIEAELTATQRTGIQRYTFPQSNESAVVLDLGHSLNWDYPGSTHIEIADSITVRGYRESSGWAKKQKVWFVTRFSRPFRQAEIIEAGQSVRERSYSGKKLKALFHYNTEAGDSLILKTGVSFVSADNAEANLEQEAAGSSFDALHTQAAKRWRQQLQKISIHTPDQDKEELFYTALYHTMLAPNLFSDVNQSYRGADRQSHRAEGYNQYTVFSLWDTFRASHPLFNLMHPERVNAFIRSMLAHYKETGALPMWPLVGNETHGMIGYHAVSVIAEAWLKGYRDYDAELAFEAMKTTAMRDTFGLAYYKEMDYIPAEAENYSVSKTLEYAYDDWCIAQMAGALNKQDDSVYFARRAENWKNVFDTTTRFMRGRQADGRWVKPFNPLQSNHFNHPYIEGNAWQYNWFVPHQPAGLIAKTGGREAFIKKLDSLFNLRQKVEGEAQSVDISGLIGQYAHGNEPSHHVAYLYAYAGAPWKTQKRVDTILKTMYAAEPDGLSGNEDCGQMSAWYVFSALGFYPVNPVSGVYVFGSPVLEEARLELPHGKVLKIKTEGRSEANKYIGRITRNGKSYNKAWIAHQDLMKGGTLTFYMQDKPNKELGAQRAHFPPSSGF